MRNEATHPPWAEASDRVAFIVASAVGPTLRQHRRVRGGTVGAHAAFGGLCLGLVRLIICTKYYVWCF